MSEQAIGYGSHVEVQHIIPSSNSLEPIFISIFLVVILFLGILIILQIREKKTKLYNPKMTKTIRVKIHE